MDSYFLEMFALSLPKDGELLHPKVSSGKSSKHEVDSQSSVVKDSQGTPRKKSGRSRSQVSGTSTRSGRQEGNSQEGGNTVLKEPGPSHQAAKDKYECTFISCSVFMYFRIYLLISCAVFAYFDMI